MNRRELTDQVTKYFGSSDHWRRLLALLQDPDPRNSHVHTYVYTSVHPESLHDILVAYFALRGWPLVRRINRIRPRRVSGPFTGSSPRGSFTSTSIGYTSPTLVSPLPTASRAARTC